MVTNLPRTPGAPPTHSVEAGGLIYWTRCILEANVFLLSPRIHPLLMFLSNTEQWFMFNTHSEWRAVQSSELQRLWLLYCLPQETCPRFMKLPQQNQTSKHKHIKYEQVCTNCTLAWAKTTKQIHPKAIKSKATYITLSAFSHVDTIQRYHVSTSNFIKYTERLQVLHFESLSDREKGSWM